MIEKTSTDKQLLQKLKDIFEDYQRRGFISLTTNYNYNDGNCSYLPWHAVCQDKSIHTNVRIFFDARCRDKRLGMSLNLFDWKSPNLTNSLVKKLLKFRTKSHCLDRRHRKSLFPSENQRRRHKILEIRLPTQRRR